MILTQQLDNLLIYKDSKGAQIQANKLNLSYLNKEDTGGKS